MRSLRRRNFVKKKKKKGHGCFQVGIHKSECDDDEVPSHTQSIADERKGRNQNL